MIGAQADWIGSVQPTRASARAAAKTAAERRAERGITSAARRADHEHAGWCASACEALRRFAAGQVGFWTIEQARAVIESTLPAAPDLRAWGKVTQMAARAGYITKTDKTAPAMSSNATAKPLWKRGPAA